MAHQTKVDKILQVSALKTYDALTYTHWHPIYNWGPWTLAGENPEFFTFNNINSSFAFKKINTFSTDLLVSMSYDQIFNDKIININN